MISPGNFPTVLHRQAAELVGDFFTGQAHVDTVLVVNSCARGRAVPESDLDLAVLVKPTASVREIQALDALWQEFMAADPLIVQFRQAGRFAQVHLDLFDGRFAPSVWDDGGGPDSFEVEIGNRIAYAAPLREAGPYFRQLQSQWLPYYEDGLRLSRLQMAREACAYDLDHVPWYSKRGLYFQAFDRLYKAFQEFLQALFIARQTYPVAYNKWIREQVERWLELPVLYGELLPILSVRDFESEELVEKASVLHGLLERWIQP